MRPTKFAPALPAQHTPTPVDAPPASGYAPPATATSREAGRFPGPDFPLQPGGTLRCPAGKGLVSHEHRRERDGSLRVAYSARIRDCRLCPLRAQCQWSGNTTAKPRQVSVLLHPLPVGSAPLLWRDWPDGTSGTPDDPDKPSVSAHFAFFVVPGFQEFSPTKISLTQVGLTQIGPIQPGSP
jgi:hypothetical protein